MSTILRKKSRTIVRDSKSDALFYVICYAIVAILCLIVLYPLIYILSASFSSPAQVSSGRVWLFPVEPTLYSYSLILQYKNVFIGYGNTVFYTVVGTMINVALTMICAYPLSRREFSGRYVCSLIFVFTMVFNAGMIPNYILIRDLHLMNTRWAMILPGAISAYNMIVARTFIQNSIPNELLEASKLDGCDDFQYSSTSFCRCQQPLFPLSPCITLSHIGTAISMPSSICLTENCIPCRFFCGRFWYKTSSILQRLRIPSWHSSCRDSTRFSSIPSLLYPVRL